MIEHVTSYWPKTPQLVHVHVVSPSLRSPSEVVDVHKRKTERPTTNRRRVRLHSETGRGGGGEGGEEEKEEQ